MATRNPRVSRCALPDWSHSSQTNSRRLASHRVAPARRRSVRSASTRAATGRRGPCSNSGVATTVLIRLASFPCRSLGELQRKTARAVAWDEVLWPAVPLAMHVSARRSRLFHTGAIEERVRNGIAEALGGAPAVAAAGVQDDGLARPQSVRTMAIPAMATSATAAVATPVRQMANAPAGERTHAETVAAASTAAAIGASGRRRRCASSSATTCARFGSTAPASRCIAGAIAWLPARRLCVPIWRGRSWTAVGYDPRGPLLDPFCGSGTIAIEAAMRARRMPPGIGRRFAYESTRYGERVRSNRCEPPVRRTCCHRHRQPSWRVIATRARSTRRPATHVAPECSTTSSSCMRRCARRPGSRSRIGVLRSVSASPTRRSAAGSGIRADCAISTTRSDRLCGRSWAGGWPSWATGRSC